MRVRKKADLRRSERVVDLVLGGDQLLERAKIQHPQKVCERENDQRDDQTRRGRADGPGEWRRRVVHPGVHERPRASLTDHRTRIGCDLDPLSCRYQDDEPEKGVALKLIGRAPVHRRVVVIRTLGGPNDAQRHRILRLDLAVGIDQLRRGPLGALLVGDVKHTLVNLP
jgi:hypothetical protein